MAGEAPGPGGPPDVVEIDVDELRAGAEKSELSRLDRKVAENIALVALASALARAGDRERASKFAEELQRRLGIPVYFDRGTEEVYPVLVIDTSNPKFVAWLVAEDELLGYPWEYVELKLGLWF